MSRIDRRYTIGPTQRRLPKHTRCRPTAAVDSQTGRGMVGARKDEGWEGGNKRRVGGREQREGGRGGRGRKGMSEGGRGGREAREGGTEQGKKR